MVWGGEFGRTPFNEKGDGRDHNPWGFTMWMAGGGVKGGQYDRLDRRDRPARGRSGPFTCTTFTPRFSGCWASITSALTYMHNGRAERPTEVYGSVIHELFA